MYSHSSYTLETFTVARLTVVLLSHQALGMRHPTTLRVLAKLSQLLHARGRSDEAEEIYLTLALTNPDGKGNGQILQSGPAQGQGQGQGQSTEGKASPDGGAAADGDGAASNTGQRPRGGACHAHG